MSDRGPLVTEIHSLGERLVGAYLVLSLLNREYN
jgi:hypothetical protein